MLEKQKKKEAMSCHGQQDLQANHGIRNLIQQSLEVVKKSLNRKEQYTDTHMHKMFSSILFE